MKTTISNTVVFFIFIMLCLSFLSLHVSAFEDLETKTVTLSPVEDAYVDSWHPNENKGKDYCLYLNSYEHPFIFIKFDLSRVPIDASIDSAQLKLYCRYSSDRANVSAHYVPDDLWDEDVITYNNRPTSISNRTKDTINVSKNSFCSWDITEDVRVALHDDKLLTEVLLWENTENGGYSSFYSKEVEQKYPTFSKYKPRLEITYAIPVSPTSTPTHTPTPTTPTPPPTPTPWWEEQLRWIIGVGIALLTLFYMVYRDRRKPKY